jgi:TRAP-type C4-dicarboxylate transport system substrate-binding protein
MRAAAGVGTDMVRAWGGVPIMMGPGDIYQSIERGTIDGFVFEFTGIQSFRLSEVTKHYTELNFFVGPFIIAMNQDSFNALPKDLQQIIMEESGVKGSTIIAEAFEEVKWQSRARIIAEGGNVIVPTEEVMAEFRVEADAYIEQWIQDRTTATFDARDFVNKTREAVARHAAQ